MQADAWAAFQMSMNTLNATNGSQRPPLLAVWHLDCPVCICLLAYCSSFHFGGMSTFLCVWPSGRGQPSTASPNRTTTLSGVISALLTAQTALIMADATSFRTAAWCTRSHAHAAFKTPCIAASQNSRPVCSTRRNSVF